MVLLSSVYTLNLMAEQVNLNPPDMTPSAYVGKGDGKPLQLIVDNKLTMPIVIEKDVAQRTRWGVDFLVESIEEMTGSKPQVLIGTDDTFNGPAIYVGNLDATQKAGFSSAKMGLEEFAVKTKDGSLYLYGRDDVQANSFGTAYAVLDFGERILGIRQYFDPAKGGRSVIKTSKLTLDSLDYGDKPMFGKRYLWPYFPRKDMLNWRIADTNPVLLKVHAPHTWRKDETYVKERPEIFQRNKDGKIGPSPMLCYSNPKTLETYLERIDEELAGKRKSDIMIGNAVTVSPWDIEVNCYCADCQKLYQPEAGSSGSASKILCSFVRKLSDALAKKHPQLTVIYLPYLNYCDAPEGVEFPAGNVEVQLCTMPGLAMLKEPRIKDHEEKLLRCWAAVTSRPVQNWHYICWPAEFTSAPYIFTDAIINHYRDMKDVISGSFVNGAYPEERLLLSAYVWMHTLWNINHDPQAIFDVFAKRMFGPAAEPVRRLISLQEDGWKKQWEIPKVSPKNIFEISYPRETVLSMQKCFQEAYALAGDDKLIQKRLDYYKKGFEEFFGQSEAFANGTAFAPLLILKVGANPVIDGKLDDPEWKKGESMPFVLATIRNQSVKYPTTVQAVWTPEGVTFGFRMTEPTPDKLFLKEAPGSWINDNVEIFFDATGKGAGDFYQLLIDARDEGTITLHAAEKNWKPKNIKSHVFVGKDFWSVEVYIPFTEFASLEGARLPTTSSSGISWIGNFMRHRNADSQSKEIKTPGSERELQRLYTRYSNWSADQNAFGPLKFME